MIFKLANNCILRAVLCFFLACLLVFCFIAPPYLQAYAIVDIILSGAISSTMSALFTLSGIKFASSSDLISGIELAWANFDKSTQHLISDLVGVGNPVGGSFSKPTTIPLPMALISGFVTAIQKVFPITQTSVPSLPSTGGAVYSPESYLIQSLFECDIELLRPIFKKYKYCSFQYSNITRKFYSFSLFNSLPAVPSTVTHSVYGKYSFCSIKFPLANSFLTIMDFYKDSPYFYYSSSNDGLTFSSNFYGKWNVSNEIYSFCSFNYSWFSTTSENLKINEFCTPVSPASILSTSKTGVLPVVPLVPEVINPADLGYTADKAICVDGVLTKAMDDVLAKNPTKETVSIVVPANAADLVDAGLKDVVTDKDLADAIDRAIANAGSGTVTGDITLPKIGDLTLPETIITVFPFCIPFDISKGIRLLQAEPVTPRWEIPFRIGTYLDEKIVIDFAPFDNIAKICRWLETFGFVFLLAVLTRKVIKW